MNSPIYPYAEMLHLYHFYIDTIITNVQMNYHRLYHPSAFTPGGPGLLGMHMNILSIPHNAEPLHIKIHLFPVPLPFGTLFRGDAFHQALISTNSKQIVLNILWLEGANRQMELIYFYFFPSSNHFN